MTKPDILSNKLPRYLFNLLHVRQFIDMLIYRRRRFDHVTSLLQELHWLKSSERVAYNWQ